jgi:hypothetical protein
MLLCSTDLTADSFPKEVTEANCLFWKGLDKEGRKICKFAYVITVYKW